MVTIDPTALPQQAIFPGAGQAHAPRRSDGRTDTTASASDVGGVASADQLGHVGDVLESLRSEERPFYGYDRSAHAKHARLIARQLNLIV